MFQDDGNFDWLLPSELPLDLRAFQALIGFRRVGLLRFEASQTLLVREALLRIYTFDLLLVSPSVSCI